MADRTPDQGSSRLGQALRTARQDAGQSIEQVSARTRIRPAVLHDLERGVRSSSGGDVYARGHVRSVAQALGVDPAPLLAALDAEAGRVAAVAGGETTPLPLQRAGSLGVPAAARPERRGPHWGGALVAALSVLVLLLGVGTFAGGESREPAAADELFAAPAVPVAPPPATTAAPVRTKTAPPPPSPGARLGLRAVAGSSWVRVQGPQGTLFEGLVRTGEAPRSFADAKELRLLVGNAAALAVACGPQELSPAGGAGAVRRFVCRPGGLVAA